MNVTVEELAPCKKLMRVEVELEKVQEAFDEVTKDFQKHAKLPGFRPGKAPKDMVAKRFDADIQDEAKRKVVSDSYRKAIADQKLTVVIQPDIGEIQFAKGQPCTFTATIEIAPSFELPEYKGIVAKRDQTTVSDDDVARALDMLRDQRAEYPVVVKEVTNGDIAVVNYTGTTDGKPLTEIAPTAKGLTEQKGFWVNIEPDAFIPGFAPQLVGMKAGEKRTVNVDFPADFVTPQLAGKKGVYEVELVEVKERKLPALDDEFAKSFGAENLDKLREGVRADLQNELNTKQSRSIRNQVVETLLGKVQCELPETLVHSETKSIVYNIVVENQQRGVPKEAIDSQKEQIYASANATAKNRVKASFIIQKIAEKEGVRVEQLEIANRLQLMATQYKMPVEKLVKELEKRDGLGDVYDQMLSEKVVDLLVLNAKIEDVAPAPQQ